jgi:hypothetical protein
MSSSSYLYYHRDLDPGRVQPDGRILSSREREIIVCERIAARKAAARAAKTNPTNQPEVSLWHDRRRSSMHRPAR